jgi:hypothetical protein
MNGIELLLLFSHQVIKTYQTKKNTGYGLFCYESISLDQSFACDIYNYHNAIASSTLQCRILFVLKISFRKLIRYSKTFSNFLYKILLFEKRV